MQHSPVLDPNNKEAIYSFEVIGLVMMEGYRFPFLYGDPAFGLDENGDAKRNLTQAEIEAWPETSPLLVRFAPLVNRAIQFMYREGSTPEYAAKYIIDTYLKKADDTSGQAVPPAPTEGK